MGCLCFLFVQSSRFSALRARQERACKPTTDIHNQAHNFVAKQEMQTAQLVVSTVQTLSDLDLSAQDQLVLVVGGCARG